MTGRDLLFGGLIATLFPQALWVRKTAPRFPAPSGATEGEAGQGSPAVRLLGIGDSIIAGVGAGTVEKALIGQAAESLAQTLQVPVAWKACGKIGLTSRSIAETLLPRIPDQPFEAILVSAGVNDIISLHGIERWCRDIGILLQALSNRWPEAAIAVAGLPPMNRFPALPQPLRAVFGMRARQFDSVLREESNAFPRVAHIPLDFVADPESFSADGFHPSENSYALFGRLAAEAVGRVIEQQGKHNTAAGTG
ncbi:MAG: SGNH/GDSL hydrolase family protein [Wenzhouxiangellaceae bacterium]|nr:SGNH/GDSL hydrolase family protein [Wenzhouxiangellaceae bacterium]